VTVLLCANSTGSEKLKPILIGKSKNPRCFKNVRVENLPIQYESNAKAWMTSELFSKFCFNWDRKLKKDGRKILLLLDNCSAHPQEIHLTQIKLVFLPANTASIIQPIDAGVIKNLKYFYRKEILKKHIYALDSKKPIFQLT